MKIPALDHVLIADPNAAQALQLARWIEVDYEVRLAEPNDSELKLNRIKSFNAFSGSIPSKSAGSIIGLKADGFEWKSFGSEVAKLGTLEYLYRKCLIGSSLYKIGPVLIYGRKPREEIAKLGESGINILSLPGIRYIQTPDVKSDELGLFIAHQFKHAVKQWAEFQAASTDANRDLLRARNKIIATGLFKSIRLLSRSLVHSYNSLLTAKRLPKIQAEFSRSGIDALAIYADSQVHYSTESINVKKFENVLRDYHEAIGDVSKRKGKRESAKVFAKISEILSELEILIAWWESLLSWSHLAITRQHQAIEMVIADDQEEFSIVLNDALKSKELALELSQTLKRELKINTFVIKPQEQPEQIIKILREQNLHESDVLTGSPVVIFQDLIINNQPDFGLKVIRRLRSRYPWLKIIAVTAREKVRFEVLEEGADFYLTKTDLLEQKQTSNAQINLDRLATALKTVLTPNPVLLMGDASQLSGQCFKLFCERYWLNPNPVSLSDQSMNEMFSRLSLEAGLPRLLLITGDQAVTYEKLFHQIMSVREICILFPELSIVLWRPDIRIYRDNNLEDLAERWFELWAKWIPNYSSRVLPIERPFASGFQPPVSEGNNEILDLFFSSEELVAVESLLRVNKLFSNLAAYNFYVPRHITPEGATGAIAAPTDVETDVADKIANRFGGSSVSIIRGRWIGEKGVADYDTIVAVESFAPATRANRAFAEEIVKEIRERRNEEVVLQIERPVSVISRESGSASLFLQIGLCDENGLIDGTLLFKSIG